MKSQVERLLFSTKVVIAENIIRGTVLYGIV
jgi:hypothetical protein